MTNSPNEDIKQAINKLKIHIEATYNLKVEKVFYELKRVRGSEKKMIQATKTILRSVKTYDFRHDYQTCNLRLQC